MKKTAYTFHHCHWDAEWYYTEQESQIQFAYHMEELLESLDSDRINTYLIDGKTDQIEDHLRFKPQDKEHLAKYVAEKRAFVGPFYSHLSGFIAPGESVIKNLQIGIQQGEELGHCCKVAYMPDSFGQPQDYPKIFNGVGIKDFVFRRGLGDHHNLKNDFNWKSNDGSQVLTNCMQAGYSFAGLAFMEGRLIKNAGLDLDKKDILWQLTEYLGNRSTQEEGFLLPAGKDNAPVMRNFKDLLAQYSEESEDFNFVETTLEDYMDKLRASDADFQDFEGELYSTQYHRVHKSIFSARPDIKSLQDRIERLLILEVQPLMAIANSQGIKYEAQMVEEVWKLLIRSQTHSEATNSDITNEQIYARAERAYLYARAIKVYLSRKLVISVDRPDGTTPVMVFNTLPTTRTFTAKLKVYSKNKQFKLDQNGNEMPYSLIEQEKVYGGWRRKHRKDFDEGRDYYLSTIAVRMEEMAGLSYQTLFIQDGERPTKLDIAFSNDTYIENDRYRVEMYQNKLNIVDKHTGKVHMDALYFENMGDQGDTFDYDNPDHDMTIKADFKNAKIVKSVNTDNYSAMTIEGYVTVPYDLEARELGNIDTQVPFSMQIRIKSDSPVIEFKGHFKNKALNHRMRIVYRTEAEHKVSIAGTQFGYLERETNPELLNIWKRDAWLERPNPIEPLLNHVSLKGDEFTTTVHTRSIKEYEVVGDNFSDLALTVYRSVGHFGLPDLNRRPGRASGLPEQIMECPLSQMVEKEINFEFGLVFSDGFEGNAVRQEYTRYAAEEVYFQDQEFNRIFTPMKYFETNKMLTVPARNAALFEVVGFEGCYSTVVSDDEGYVLRLFNNANHEVAGGRLMSQQEIKSVSEVDLRHRFIKGASQEIAPLRAGEIRSLRIKL